MELDYSSLCCKNQEKNQVNRNLSAVNAPSGINTSMNTGILTLGKNSFLKLKNTCVITYLIH